MVLVVVVVVVVCDWSPVSSWSCDILLHECEVERARKAAEAAAERHVVYLGFLLE